MIGELAAPSLERARYLECRSVLTSRLRTLSARDRVVLLTSFGAIFLAFVPAAIRHLVTGWRPIQDDGAISIRAWQALSLHGPSLGQYSQLSTAHHVVYDLGPLEYWLLALPVHLDPAGGALWGAALWCVVAGIVTVVAARAAYGSVGSVVAAITVVATATWQIQVAINAPWNPYFGVEFYLATIACSVAATTRDRRWWPAAVVCGSVAVQCHDMFLLAAVLVLASGAFALAREIRESKAAARSVRLRWLAAGLALGAGCWIVPVLQQITGHPGNMSMVLHAGRGPRLGVLEGLRMLAASIGPFPRPDWTIIGPARYFTHDLASRSPIVGALIFVVTAGIAAMAYRKGRRDLGNTAALALVLQLWVTMAIAIIPASRSNENHTWQLVLLSLPAGIVTYAAVGAAILWFVKARVAGTAWSTRHVRHRGHAGQQGHPASSRHTGLISPALGLAGLLTVLVACTAAAQVNQVISERDAYGFRFEVRAVEAAVTDITHTVHERQFVLRVRIRRHGFVHPSGESYIVAMGIAAELIPQGWRPVYRPRTTLPSYPELARRVSAAVPRVVVTVVSPGEVTVSQRAVR